MLSRRDFLKMIGAFSIVFTPLNKLMRKIPSVSKGGELQDGEIYEGFVLLPADAELPPFIVPSKIKKPKEKGKSSIIYKEFNSIEDIRRHLKKPIYVIDEAKRKANFVGGNMFGYFDKEIFGMSLGFRDPISTPLTEDANISIWARYDFPHPYPLWNEAPTDDDHSGYVLEKVDYLPTPGVKFVTYLGFTFCWIERNTLFMLILENSPTIDDALLFVSSLRSVQ